MLVVNGLYAAPLYVAVTLFVPSVVVFILSLFVMVYALIMWATGQTVNGWAFTICSIWLVAGIQMVSLGLIGEYVGKIYAETKRRPRYYIEEVIRKEK